MNTWPIQPPRRKFLCGSPFLHDALLHFFARLQRNAHVRHARRRAVPNGSDRRSWRHRCPYPLSLLAIKLRQRNGCNVSAKGIRTTLQSRRRVPGEAYCRRLSNRSQILRSRHEDVPIHHPHPVTTVTKKIWQSYKDVFFEHSLVVLARLAQLVRASVL